MKISPEIKATNPSSDQNLIQESYNKDGALRSVIRIVNPPTVSKSSVFVPKWGVVMSSLAGVAICIFFAASLIVLTFPRPALYKDDCTGRSCLHALNMKCLNNTCTCGLNFYYAKGCKQKKEYLDHCDANNQEECIDGLICESGMCQCNETSYWHAGQCTKKRTYGDSCSNDIQCKTDLLLYCSSQKSICTCESNR